MGTLTAEDFSHTPSARMKVLAVQCGEAFVNDNTVGAVWKSPDSFLHGRNGLISDTGDIRRPVKQQVTSKRFDETGHEWESIAPMAGIKLNIKAVRVDKHDKPVFGLHGNEVGDFGDHLLDILQKNGVELQDLRLPGARAQKEMMIIDEYDRGREQMEQNIGNATQNWEAAKKSAVHAAEMAYAGQYSFQFMIPISASEDQIKKLAAAIGEIARTTEPLQSPGL